MKYMAPSGAILKGYVATMNIAKGEHILRDQLRMYIYTSVLIRYAGVRKISGGCLKTT